MKFTIRADYSRQVLFTSHAHVETTLGRFTRTRECFYAPSVGPVTMAAAGGGEESIGSWVGRSTKLAAGMTFSVQHRYSQQPITLLRSSNTARDNILIRLHGFEQHNEDRSTQRIHATLAPRCGLADDPVTVSRSTGIQTKQR